MPQKREFERQQRTRIAMPDRGLQLAQNVGEVLLEDVILEQQYADAGSLQQVLQLRCGGEGTQRDRNGPCQRDTEDRREKFGPVGHQYADAAVLANADGYQGTRDLD
jgi:hypothetical protein